MLSDRPAAAFYKTDRLQDWPFRRLAVCKTDSTNSAGQHFHANQTHRTITKDNNAMTTLRTFGTAALCTLALAGCVVTAKWRALVETAPNSFHQVLVNTSGNAVHVYVSNNQLNISTYDDKGILLTTQSDSHVISAASKTLDLAGGRLLVVGATLNSNLIIDSNTGTVSTLDESLLPEGAGNWTLSGVSQAFSTQVAAYGSRLVEGNAQAWVLVWNVADNTFTQVDIPGLASIEALYSNDHLVVQGTAAEERWVVTLDASLSELGRFVVPSADETLIGDSQGRPVFFDATTKNVAVHAPDGTLAWQFSNSEYTYIRGESVGPDGSVLLWGDHANYSLFAFRTDNAHFLRLTPDGALAYHYLAGNPDMARIDYRNIKQFNDGSIQLSVQGLGGELSGLIMVDGVFGVPYRTTKEIQHDFVSATGTKTRWMREPIRVEVISRTSAWLIELVSQSGGHCNNRDVFNVDRKRLLTVSELCGASTPSVVISSY